MTREEMKQSEKEWDASAKDQGHPRLLHLWPNQCRSVSEGARCLRSKEHDDFRPEGDIKNLHVGLTHYWTTAAEDNAT